MATPMRFSLGTLFVAMTVFAIGCGIAVIVPVELSHLVIGLIWMIAISLLIVGMVFGRDDKRAFSIGAFVVASSVWTDLGGRFMQGVHYLYEVPLGGSRIALPIMLWLDFAVLAAVAVATGLLCVKARAFFES